MNESRILRRNFLKWAAGTGAVGWAGAGLAGCGTLQRIFGPDPGIYDNEVLIVGAGLAGLSAAYELKKRRIPFRVVEASSRPGGRVQTLYHLNESQQYAELGAEYVDPRHRQLLDLCAEMGVSLEEVPLNKEGTEATFFREGKWLSLAQLQKDLGPVLKELVSLRQQVWMDQRVSLNDLTSAQRRVAEGLDRTSVRDLFQSLKLDPGSSVAADYLAQAARVRFGAEIENQSSLQFLASLDPEARGGRPRRIKGGAEHLTRTLYDRVRGVLPEFFVRFQTSMLSIQERGPLFECRLQMPQGQQTVWSRFVIFATPPAALQRIEGIQNLKISGPKKAALQKMKFATHSRVILGFHRRFWKDGPIILGGAALGLPRLQSLDDISRGQEGEAGILSFTIGGEAGRMAGVELSGVAKKELQSIWKNIPARMPSPDVVKNWSRQRGVEGSMLNCAPGEMTRWAGLFETGDYEDRLVFAGEHTSELFYGTMQGAVESGRRAAEKVTMALEKTLKSEASTQRG